MSERDSKAWTITSRVLALLQGVAVLWGIGFGATQLRDLRNATSAQLMLEFDRQLSTDTNVGLVTAIENGTPILRENGGTYDTAQVDLYLGTFELLDNAYQAGLITDQMLYSAFSYPMVRTYQHPEILGYLQKIREIDKEFFVGGEVLAKNLQALDDRDDEFLTQ